MASFDERLAELRIEKKKTHQDMADLLGITRQAYGNYESGKREPDFKTLSIMADYFGVISDYILGKSDYRTPEELAAKWNEVAGKSSNNEGERNSGHLRAYQGGGDDWTEEEKAAADAYVEMLRKRKKDQLEKHKK
ncbi:helix-turn-helix domain-containing protein [Paenibacillus anseongensis]|uniref:helix-turn-helix domain-containing protein n=1 Tax=Paenibacillus TaxID=44249 RepID=UPI0037C7E999